MKYHAEPLGDSKSTSTAGLANLRLVQATSRLVVLAFSGFITSSGIDLEISEQLVYCKVNK